jgi:hypothetical protein
MGIEELRNEVLKLNPESRAYLAKELINSLDTMNEVEIECLWVNEAARRDDELDKGLAQACPAKEVLSRARASRK